MKDINKSLLWMFFGACISILVGLLFIPPVEERSVCLLSFLTFFVFCKASGLVSKLEELNNKCKRKGNILFPPPKVGIINLPKDDENLENLSSNTNIYPSEWKKEIEKLAEDNIIKIKVDLIDAKKSFDSYVAIINPYGGCYPEKDMKNFQTLNDIFNYVNKGGRFVNIADIPGYWLYSISLKRKLEAAKSIYGIGVQKNGEPYYRRTVMFAEVPFMQRLGLMVDQKDIEGNDLVITEQFRTARLNIIGIKANRVIHAEGNIDPIIIEPKEEKTPFFKIIYGDGFFLISLLFIGKDYPQNYGMKEVIIRVLLELLKKK